MKNAKKRVDLPDGVTLEITGPEDAVERFLRQMQTPPLPVHVTTYVPTVVHPNPLPKWYMGGAWNGLEIAATPELTSGGSTGLEGGTFARSLN